VSGHTGFHPLPGGTYEVPSYPAGDIFPTRRHNVSDGEHEVSGGCDVVPAG
jgi:hypothetical protein